MFLFAEVSLAQNDFQDTTWFDSDWKEMPKKSANYYRTIKKMDNGFLVSDYYLNGNPQMIAEASQVKPTLIKEGACFFYLEDKKVSSKGMYTNNNQIGKWVEYVDEGKDSIIYTVLKNGKKEYSRYSDKDKNGNYLVVEVMPQFPGGVNEMMVFFSKNSKYPKQARKKNWTGKTYISFIVNDNGELQDYKIVKSSGYEILDNEALRVMKAMPKWEAGSQNGKNVPVLINIPFNFTLK